MFRKILIANRGEIARRVIRTARRMNVRTVAVYSDADAEAPHVREADEAYRLGPPAAAESYLKGELILDCAKACGAEAIHPGYGFLSENAGFAEACAKRGVVFIGPQPHSIRAMGDKAASKQLMRAAGVPLAEGYDGDDQTADRLADAAADIGWPVMIKASAGGGGKGMRIVRAEKEFAAALESCRREAASSFGDDRVLVEKFIERPRHVEVQVFGDAHGTVAHLFTRDCSAQRRHQKVIEEAPAPNLPPETAEQLHAAAIAAAKAVDYQGAGTVEFLLGQDGSICFMEMNTRLQVEHPVTEMITGLDLVEWQLRVAAGEPLPLAQDQIRVRGHSVEARLYAEDPENEFLPSTGRLAHLATPAEAWPERRVDAGVVEGGTVSPHYDPMIGKLIAWGPSRGEAREGLAQMLEETRVVGPETNRDFLVRLLRLEEFADDSAERLDTGLIQRNAAALAAPAHGAPVGAYAAAALFDALGDADAPAPGAPFEASDAWRLAGPAPLRLVYAEIIDGAAEETVVWLRREDRGAPGETARFSYWACAPSEAALLPYGPASAQAEGDAPERIEAARRGPRIDFTLDHLHRLSAHVAAEKTAAGDLRRVFFDGARWTLMRRDPLAMAGAAEEDVGGLRAPMPGKVARLLVNPGAKVARGDALLVLEAMKMEHTIQAPADGVAALLVAEGDQVEEGEALAEIGEG